MRSEKSSLELYCFFISLRLIVNYRLEIELYNHFWQISSKVSFKFSIRVSTFYLLNTIGGFIFKTLCNGPSLLTNTSLSLIFMIIFFAKSPSYTLDYLLFTISIPWNKPIPLISPTHSNGKIYLINLSFKYIPV
jgi:hypothetical protein